MKLSNVIGTGIGGVLCASLLMACADGRGTTGFKSYQYTKEQLAMNKAQRDAQNKPPANTASQNGLGTDDSAIVDSNAKPPVLPDAPRKGPEAPLHTPPPPDMSGAKQNVLNEPSAANRSAVDLSTTKTVQDMNVTIEGLLAEKKDNPVTAELIKGITIVPTGSDDARKFSLQALVVVNGEEVYMNAEDVKVSFLKNDAPAPKFLFTLTKPCGDVVLAKNLLVAYAKCSEATCREIEVLLSFETKGVRADAALFLAPGKTGWEYVKTKNVGTPKTFNEVQKSCAPAPGLIPAPETDGGTSSAPEVNTRGAIGTGETAPETSYNVDKCEELDGEGFSICDSPAEKNRVRQERQKQKESRDNKDFVLDNSQPNY